MEWGGGRAIGGPVKPGTQYLVGEKGPELFTPNQSGQITPNNKLASTDIMTVRLELPGGQSFDLPTTREAADSFYRFSKKRQRRSSR